MVQTFLLFDTITNEKTVKFVQRDIIASTITWHLGVAGSNNFGEYTSFSPFILLSTSHATETNNEQHRPSRNWYCKYKRQDYIRVTNTNGNTQLWSRSAITYEKQTSRIHDHALELTQRLHRMNWSWYRTTHNEQLMRDHVHELVQNCVKRTS